MPAAADCGRGNTSSSSALTASISQAPFASTTDTVPSWLTRNTRPSAPTGEAKYLSIAPFRRPCFSTAPVAGSKEIRMPLSFTMNSTSL